MSATTIVDVQATPLDLALIEPFTIATGSQAVARNVLVVVRLAGGARGYGEAAPFPAVTGETQESTLAALHALKSAIDGADARTWRALAAQMRPLQPAAAAARCALETAILDALLRHAGIPMWSFFGGCATEIETDMTITARSDCSRS